MPAQDYGNSRNLGLTAPAYGAFTITPTDSATEFDWITRAIHVGGAGNLALVMEDGSTVTLTGCLAGMVYPVRARRVAATGTTATNLVGFY